VRAVIENRVRRLGVGAGALCALVAVASPAFAFAPNPAMGEAAASALGQPTLSTSGSGSGMNQLSAPFGAAIDPTTGKLFVADRLNNRVLRFGSAAILVAGATAEAAFGQTAAGTSQTQLDGASDVFIDTAGRLWVADTVNNRVLRFDNASAATTGAAASMVLGQATFVTSASGSAANQLNQPRGVTGDAAGNIWIADSGNNRVLRFASAAGASNGAAATSVLGQPGFGSAAAATSAVAMSAPSGVNADAGGRVWVADTSNNRVLRFDGAASLGNGAPASGVLGQSTFVTSTSALTATGMSLPWGISSDGSGRLFVADAANNRVLAFDAAAALANGASATGVLGQQSFTASASGVGASALSLPIGVLQTNDANVLLVVDTSNNRVLRFGAPTPTVPATTPVLVVALAGLLAAAGARRSAPRRPARRA
jgi:sugar lactone lactonase YvrE